MPKGGLLRNGEKILTRVLVEAGLSSRKVAKIAGVSRSTALRMNHNQSNSEQDVKLLSPEQQRDVLSYALSKETEIYRTLTEKGVTEAKIAEAPLHQVYAAKRGSLDIIRTLSNTGGTKMSFVEERYDISPQGQATKQTLTVTKQVEANACLDDKAIPVQSTACDES